jgi:hypothetical protein
VPKGVTGPRTLGEDVLLVVALAMRPTTNRRSTHHELHRQIGTMLVSRFNGVAWFHDVHTIAHHCEKQVVFPVQVTNVGLPISHGPMPGGRASSRAAKMLRAPRHIQTLDSPNSRSSRNRGSRGRGPSRPESWPPFPNAEPVAPGNPADRDEGG